MAGAAERGQLEAKLTTMSDGQIVDALERAADYEPWALELFRAELGRRSLAPELQEELRAESAAQVVVEERQHKHAETRIYLRLIGITIFFLIIVVRFCVHGR
jgi:hypothetical protein